METKKGVFVSAMKDRIIQASIEGLRNEGLKFSVDLLANKLKISKKTVCKYFPTKRRLWFFHFSFYDSGNDSVSVCYRNTGRDLRCIFDEAVN